MACGCDFMGGLSMGGGEIRQARAGALVLAEHLWRSEVGGGEGEEGDLAAVSQWGCCGQAVPSLCWSPVSFQEAGADALSRGRTGTVRPSLKPWQEEPAVRTGREAFATRAGHCSASFRCPGS